MRIYLIFVLLLSCSSFADEKYYDSKGIYQGKKTDSGKFYSRTGRYEGKEDSRGRLYDRQGSYEGRVIEDDTETNSDYPVEEDNEW
jgi:hypothetical protein